jgi:hypothetical protein
MPVIQEEKSDFFWLLWAAKKIEQPLSLIFLRKNQA